jgi:hypothetical protein
MENINFKIFLVLLIKFKSISIYFINLNIFGQIVYYITIAAPTILHPQNSGSNSLHHQFILLLELRYAIVGVSSKSKWRASEEGSSN